MDSGLGNFGKLPFELRTMIWGKPAYPGYALRTSRAIHDEISNQFYPSKTLVFDIAGDCPKRTWATEFPLCDKSKTFVKMLHPSYLACRKLRIASEPDMRPWFYLPYSRLQSVEIHLKAPNPARPGEAVAMWIRVLCW